MIGSYNGVDFDVTSITDFSMVPQWSEDGIDYLYTEFTVGLVGLLNPKAMSYIAGPVADPDKLPPETLVAIRHALLQPRCVLKLDIFEDVFLRSPQAVPGAPGQFFQGDALNGPQPLDFAVVRFDGARTWAIRWKVKTWLRECPGGSPNLAGAMLSNRFSQSDDTDGQWLTTRTTTGVAAFRNDVLDRNAQVADEFRNVLALKVPRGMQRVGFVFTVDPARNKIRYHVVDREQSIDLGDTDPRKDLPGRPGFKRSGAVDVGLTYSASTATDPGGFATPTTIAQVAVTVKGSKLASLWRLSQYALEIGMRKLPIGQGARGNFIRHAAFVQDHKAMTVQFVCAMQIFNQADNIVPLVLLNDRNLRLETLDVFGDNHGANPFPPNADGTRGTMTANLITAALTTACQTTFQPPANFPQTSSQSSQTGDPTDSAATGPAVVVNFGEVLDEGPSGYLSADGTDSDQSYTSYSVRIRYEPKLHRLIAPTAGRTGAPTRIITTARPVTLMIATWDAERVNGKPRIPAPESNDPNLVLLEPKLGAMGISTNPTADAKVWHISGEYSYVMKRPKIPGTDPLPLAVLPWTSLVYEEHTIEPGDYHHGIIDPAGASSLASL